MTRPYIAIYDKEKNEMIVFHHFYGNIETTTFANKYKKKTCRTTELYANKYVVNNREEAYELLMKLGYKKKYTKFIEISRSLGTNVNGLDILDAKQIFYKTWPINKKKAGNNYGK